MHKIISVASNIHQTHSYRRVHIDSYVGFLIFNPAHGYGRFAMTLICNVYIYIDFREGVSTNF